MSITKKTEVNHKDIVNNDSTLIFFYTFMECLVLCNMTKQNTT